MNRRPGTTVSQAAGTAMSDDVPPHRPRSTPRRGRLGGGRGRHRRRARSARARDPGLGAAARRRQCIDAALEPAVKPDIEPAELAEPAEPAEPEERAEQDGRAEPDGRADEADVDAAYAALIDGLYSELADWIRGCAPGLDQQEARRIAVVACM